MTSSLEVRAREPERSLTNRDTVPPRGTAGRDARGGWRVGRPVAGRRWPMGTRPRPGQTGHGGRPGSGRSGGR